ncbi:penicillin acylase family protein [Nocardioides sp. Kera G14]|uniref:penicillin acylase family protein n=1 Tax=Nocardioides sp. Kera G14 TaxID=2884264 RepID=UPI001D130721|nr:penicillin acylase family protein [Nocardioides sp. Kera G14]UDY24776.1 penicillin acylase family protein [Nocardioides sp. Kera G14]
MRCLAALAAGLLTVPLLAALPVGTARAADAPYPQTYADAGDYCLGQCSSILPPGNDGTATVAEILANQLLGTQPAHADDALQKYAGLASAYTGLTDDQLSDYFNDASFVLSPDNIESTQRPGGRSDVTVVYDKKTGTPHIYGTTREGTEFGAGYVAGQERLWLMDVLRHLGRGELTSFAGGAASNRNLESQFYQLGAYTEADRQAEVDSLAHSGPRGALAVADVTSYVAGINQYITDSKASLSFPGEYVLTGNADVTGNGIQPFKPTDLVAISGIIAALFGTGGGNQLQAALVKLAAEQQFGTTTGDKVWAGLREEDDPEATLTVHGRTFPYAASPADPVGPALPDAGSVVAQPVVYDATGSAADTAEDAAAARSARSSASAATIPGLSKLTGMSNEGVLPGGLLDTKHSMSNALVVSGRHTDDGHPIAVFGPQTGYFAPQLLLLEDIHGPGIQAQGAAFAGLSMYVLLGRGQDYSWSATSANQNIIDTFAVPLCNTDGSPATLDSSAYVFHGVCTPMDVLSSTEAWSPTIADSTPAGSYTLRAYRTKYGMVGHRATIGGKPVAYTTLRSTYLHDADTLLGFQMLNDPDLVKGPKGFQEAASHIGYTFNWFYIDDEHTAYFNSGLDPQRATNVDPNLPVWGTAAYEWRNWAPATNTATDIGVAAHPQVIDQDYMISWNNRIADGYTQSFFGMGSVYRGDLLDDRVRALIGSGLKITRASLAGAMEDAAVTDLKGEDVLPTILRVIDSAPVTDPTQKATVSALKSWLAAGAKRTETTAGSKKLSFADTIKTMDAWWPLLTQAEFGPTMGTQLYDALADVQTVDESPAAAHSGVKHQGAAYEHGWWSYVDKDLRTVLGDPVQGGLGTTFCGNGSLSACRAALLQSLSQATAATYADTYPADTVCSAGDQWCAGAIQQNPLGGVTHALTTWQNRPTFQQLVQFPSHRAVRDPADPTSPGGDGGTGGTGGTVTNGTPLTFRSVEAVCRAGAAIRLTGHWTGRSSRTAHLRRYCSARATARRRPTASYAFVGQQLRLVLGTAKKGGTAKLLIDGKVVRTLPFKGRSKAPRWRTVTVSLAPGRHTMIIRQTRGSAYLDRVMIGR